VAKAASEKALWGTAGVGYEQAPGRLGEQPVDIRDPIGGGRVRAARPCSQVEDRRRLQDPGGTHGVIVLTQAGQ
jgi:hypothetical protein